MTINELVKDFNRNDYQRDNFDAFLEAIHFSFDVPAIHIAGTNGKGSTAHYLASIYAQNSYKTGLFSSPALLNQNELIQINGEPISDKDFEDIFNEYKKQFKKYDLSIFEIETFIAYTYFAKQKCDIVVIECGMGGELDATNIINPVLSIITSISLEHTDFLGHSISEIAMQKCGIIKRKTPVLIDDFESDAANTIIKDVKEKEATIHYIKRHLEYNQQGNTLVLNYYPFGDVTIQSLADYEIKDVAFALEAVLVLRDRFPVKEELVVKGVNKVKMPCRFEIVHENPIVIIDGAHNAEAATATVSAYMHRVRKTCHVIFSCFRDKNLTALLAQFGSLPGELTLTTFPHPRARTEDEFFLFLDEYAFQADPIALLKQKMEEFPDDAILVCGSLAFAAYIKKEVFHGQ